MDIQTKPRICLKGASPDSTVLSGVFASTTVLSGENYRTIGGNDLLQMIDFKRVTKVFKIVDF